MALSISLLIIVFLQIFFLSILLVAFSRRKEEMNSNFPPASIIVCAHDEEDNLRILVPLLLAQQYPQYEVIIVNDRSNDNTYDYLLEATHLHPNLKMVNVSETPSHINAKKFAVTLAVKAARYEWLVFTDADCRPPSPLWLSNMSKRFAPPVEFVLGVSLYQRLPGFLNSFIRFEAIITAIQYIGWAVLNMPYMGVGRNMAYRKEVFTRNKGFNRHLSVTGGDDDLFVNAHAHKGNTQCVVGADTLVMSTPKATWREFFNQKIRHLAVGKKYKFGHRLVLGVFSLTWILTWFVVLPLAPLLPLRYWILGAFIMRLALFTLLVHKSSRALGSAFESWKTPFLDFIYAFYYLVAAPVALLTKKVRWKN